MAICEDVPALVEGDPLEFFATLLVLFGPGVFFSVPFRTYPPGCSLLHFPQVLKCPFDAVTRLGPKAQGAIALGQPGSHFSFRRAVSKVPPEEV